MALQVFAQLAFIGGLEGKPVGCPGRQSSTSDKGIGADIGPFCVKTTAEDCELGRAADIAIIVAPAKAEQRLKPQAAVEGNIFRKGYGKRGLGFFKSCLLYTSDAADE